MPSKSQFVRHLALSVSKSGTSELSARPTKLIPNIRQRTCMPLFAIFVLSHFTVLPTLKYYYPQTLQMDLLASK